MCGKISYSCICKAYSHREDIMEQMRQLGDTKYFCLNKVVGTTGITETRHAATIKAQDETSRSVQQPVPLFIDDGDEDEELTPINHDTLQELLNCICSPYLDMGRSSTILVPSHAPPNIQQAPPTTTATNLDSKDRQIQFQ
ncbi:uncharacterized protein LOC144772462 isoform X2 [Lissotriton helveticus]